MPGPVCLVSLPNHLYRPEGKSELYSLYSNPSLTKQTNQQEQMTSETPQPEPSVETLNSEKATFKEHM